MQSEAVPAINVEVLNKGARHLGADLTTEERQLLDDVMHALRSIRYGSVLLTIHDGRIIEIQKTQKIRRKALSAD